MDKKFSFPNFDDVDLGIIGIVILGVVGFAAGLWIISSLDGKLESKDVMMLVPAVFAFGQSCITGISALVRGLKRNGNKVP